MLDLFVNKFGVCQTISSSWIAEEPYLRREWFPILWEIGM